MALNMFIIEHTKLKAQDPDNYRTVAQNSALQVKYQKQKFETLNL